MVVSCISEVCQPDDLRGSQYQRVLVSCMRWLVRALRRPVGCHQV